METENKQNVENNQKKLNFRKPGIRWTLLLYDLVITVGVSFLLVYFFIEIKDPVAWVHVGLIALATIVSRLAWLIYTQIWRYASASAYLRMILADATTGVAVYLIELLVFPHIEGIDPLGFFKCAAIIGLNLAIALGIRLVYRYAYKNMRKEGWFFSILRALLKVFAGIKFDDQRFENAEKVKLAIVGAGRTGISLANEISTNIYSGYEVKAFIDIDKEKIGRMVASIPVFAESDVNQHTLEKLGITEVIFAMPNMENELKGQLYKRYKDMGFKIRAYDYPYLATANGDNKKTLRDFDIEELLFRDPVKLFDENTYNYYRNKIIMITGGGGSIGSELARQVAKMNPELILLVDIYENGAYDVQQELKLLYKNDVQVKVEILSVTNKVYLEKLFKRYHIDVVIHAAAHKHVPLMERNSIEAIANNVFGTLNVVDLAYQYQVEHFIMVSTDKAVNPTNVMGATKRMCEMIVQAYSTRKDSKTKFSATRFGNVLGSAGSVIPLFKKQIANGGPVTLTDKRIIRYFMTIPEASMLVLESGYMAKNGELFVLDMGKPIKILDLAENMIRLSGYRPNVDIEIKEIGLRPGEKLYEELLIKTENLDKTSNAKIFIEKDVPITMDELNEKLEILRKCVESNRNSCGRPSLMKVVPTFRNPEDINKDADDSDEMREIAK